MAQWVIFYEDGTIQENIWDDKGGVVAVVEYGGVSVIQTLSGPIEDRYKTLYYEDEDEAEELGSPLYFFWKQGGKFGAGYKVPAGANFKKGADLLSHPDGYASIFELMGKA